MSFHWYKRFAAGMFAVLACGCLLLGSARVSAQTTKVLLPRQQVTLSELFGEIRRQTGATVVFDEASVPTGRTVTFSGREGTVAELLTQALTAAGYTWQTTGNYILVRVADTKPATPVPQPTRAEFERDIRNYTQENIPAVVQPQEVVIRYDTVRTVKPHSGVFTYPAQQTAVTPTRRTARTPFMRDTPPLLAVKTNLAWWATGGTPNLAGEIGLGKRTTLEVAGGNNRWNLQGSERDNKKMVHWTVKSEFRYWLCERFTTGHFFGVHAIYGKYNVGGYDIPMLFEKEFRYEGDAFGGGISYGYNLAFSKRWGVEFTAGVGMLQLDYMKKECEKCGAEVGRYKKTYFGPTNLGVKMTFMIK